MREHKSAIEKQMADRNENSKRDIVCEVCMYVPRRRRVRGMYRCTYSCVGVFVVLPGIGGVYGTNVFA